MMTAQIPWLAPVLSGGFAVVLALRCYFGGTCGSRTVFRHGCGWCAAAAVRLNLNRARTVSSGADRYRDR